MATSSWSRPATAKRNCLPSWAKSNRDKSSFLSTGARITKVATITWTVEQWLLMNLPNQPGTLSQSNQSLRYGAVDDHSSWSELTFRSIQTAGVKLTKVTSGKPEVLSGQGAAIKSLEKPAYSTAQAKDDFSDRERHLEGKSATLDAGHLANPIATRLLRLVGRLQRKYRQDPWRTRDPSQGRVRVAAAVFRFR